LTCLCETDINILTTTTTKGKPVKVLLVLLVVALFLSVAWAIGYMTGKSKAQLSRSDRRELNTLRALRNDLAVSASEHATLGDEFGVIVISKITETYRELRKGDA
jgi:phosphoglycerol transferase MdoB-like AlkP superfamily enzyme